jgi:hypothetical protein
VNRTVAGIVLATFFSDCSHEISTAVLPLYLTAIGHGPAALAVIEGVADFLVSLSRTRSETCRRASWSVGSCREINRASPSGWRQRPAPSAWAGWHGFPREFR